MGILQRGFVNKYRVTVPSYLQQAVPVITLGMPSLPIGTQAPMSAIHAVIPKGDKVVTSGISGTSLGGFNMAGEKAKSKNRGQHSRGFGQASSRSKVNRRSKAKSNGTSGNAFSSNIQSKRSTGKKKGILRGTNGKFLRKGGK